jgi:DNA-binding transcriptional ArsR family regulator
MTMKATSTGTGQASGGKPVVPDAAALQAAASLFRSLGDPSRLAILSHLLLGEHRVVELTEHLGLAQSTVSAHLRCLLDCGLVQSRPVGRASMFSVTHEPDVLAVLAAAEGLLASTGDAVVLCPVYGAGSFETRENGHE